MLTFASELTYAQGTPDLATQLATIDTASSGAPILKTPERIKEAFDNCIHANLKTEFDTAETLLARAAKAPCRFGGIVTYRGRGDELAGDVLQYDAQRQVIYWDIPLKRLENLFHGLEGASPYDVATRKSDAKSLTSDQKKAVRAAGNTDYLLLPIYGEKNVISSYEATNAFGARIGVSEISGVRYSIAVNVGNKIIGIGEPFRVATAPLSREKAADFMPFLDLKLYWIAANPCDECLFAGAVERGTLGGPTLSKPYDIKLLHNYVFAKLIAVRFVDRRDGVTLAISSGSQSSLTH